MKAMLLTAVLMVFIGIAAAQKPMDEASEKNVHITQGPTITNNSGSNATLTWTTDHQGANHVRYRRAGSNEQWKSAYHSGGGTNHSLQLTGLQAGQTYEYQILTRDGDLRTSGQFQAGNGSGGTSTASNSGAPSSTPTSADAPAATSNSDKVILYREVGPNGVHTFGVTPTSSLPGFHSEGVAGYILKSQKGGTVPLYRLTNAQGDTLLTTDASERTSAAAAGYQDQGVVGYIATTNWRGTSPLYRMANQNSHFYTTSAQEQQSATGLGFHEEKTVGYIWTQQ